MSALVLFAHQNYAEYYVQFQKYTTIYDTAWETSTYTDDENYTGSAPNKVPENIAKGLKTIGGKVNNDRYDYNYWSENFPTFQVNPYHGTNSDDFTILTEKNSTVKNLRLVDNKNIEFLPIKVSEIFPNLLQYSSENCLIKTISYANFKGLFKLKVLNLAHNQIERLETGFFDDFNNLGELRLTLNKINFIAEDAFKNLNNLDNLLLNGNQIKTLSFSVGHSWKYVNIGNNQVTSIPKGFLRDSMLLTTLDAQANLIESIYPTTFGRMEVLRSVNLRDNSCIDEYYQDYQEFIPYTPGNIRTLRYTLQSQCIHEDADYDNSVLAAMECLLDLSFHHCMYSKILTKIYHALYYSF